MKYASSMKHPGEKRKILFHESVRAYGPSLSEIEVTIESIVDAPRSSIAMGRKGSYSPISEKFARRDSFSELEKLYDRETYVRLAEAGARWKALILHLDVVEENLLLGQRRKQEYQGPPWSTQVDSWPVVQIGDAKLKFCEFGSFSRGIYNHIFIGGKLDLAYQTIRAVEFRLRKSASHFLLSRESAEQQPPAPERPKYVGSDSSQNPTMSFIKPLS